MAGDICGAQLRYGAADIVARLRPLANGTGVLLKLQILQNVITLLNYTFCIDNVIQGVLIRPQTLFEV